MPFCVGRMGDDSHPSTTDSNLVASEYHDFTRLFCSHAPLVKLRCGLLRIKARIKSGRRQPKKPLTIKRDTKAVAQGVKEGLSNKRTVDLNKASKDDLASLPGITPHQAERIIAERPFASPHQLVTRSILSEDEYSQIQDRVVVNR